MLISRQIKAYILKLLASKESVDFEIKNAKKILFFRYDRIGDMVITTPVFRELKREYPEINISVLASNTNQNVLHNNPYIDKVYINYKNNLFRDLPTLLKLRNKRYDVCVEFDHSVIPHSIVRLRIIKPKKIISVFKNQVLINSSALVFISFLFSKFIIFSPFFLFTLLILLFFNVLIFLLSHKIKKSHTINDTLTNIENVENLLN